MLITGASSLVTAIAVWGAQHTRAELRATRLQLSAALQRAADAEAGKETALRLLDDQRQRRSADFETFRAQVEELRESYDRVIRQYQIAHGIHGPLVSRRVQ